MPSKTPRETVERLSREVNLALQDPEVRAQLEKLALVIRGSSPDELAAAIREGALVWARFARESGPQPR